MPPRHPSQGALPGLRWWPFIILAAAGTLVFLNGAHRGPAAVALTMVSALVLAMGLAMAVFLEVVARLCLSRRRLAAGFDASPEAARTILDATAGLTRMMSVATAIFMALVVLPQMRLPGFSQGRALGLGTAILLGATLWSVWSLKSVHRRLEQTGQLRGLEGWNGIIYSNPKDPRLWVPKIAGLGTTLNYAHARAWLILGVILALSLGAAAAGLVAAFRR